MLRMRRWWWIAGILLSLPGCGTVRCTDSQRTATEQLLISDAIDRSVSQFDFRPLAGKTVYLDATALASSVDAPYLTSSLRQQMFSHHCVMMDKREDAEYVVEARSGGIGTDHRETIFGFSATKVSDATIPEVPFAKKTEQRAVAKVALFAFNRETGEPVWQSGAVPIESRNRDLWVLGIGPFQKGHITDASNLAASKAGNKGKSNAKEMETDTPVASQEMRFAETPNCPKIVASHPAVANAAQANPKAAQTSESPLNAVMPASHTATESATPKMDDKGPGTTGN
jgi:hypothetical protein